MPYSETIAVEVSQLVRPSSNRIRSTSLGVHLCVQKFISKYGRAPEWDSVTITATHVTNRVLVELVEER